MITVSAPGKLMLMGEHAVVYGYPCIVTAVSERLTVAMEETNSGKIVVEAPQVKNTRFVDQAIIEGCKAWGIQHTGLLLQTKSNFSNCYGFGSSSAVTVATLFALVRLFEKNVDKKELFEIAYKTVLAIQGVGSGFDVAAAIYGETLLYGNAGQIMNPLPWKLEDDGVTLVVGYSGMKADTPVLVKEVAQKREKEPEKVNRIFEAIGKLVLQAREQGDAHDWHAFGKFMNFNQEYLRDLGVSTEKLEAMIFAANKAGAYGAKLSGAGGGDCIIALVPKEKQESVENAIIKAGGSVVPVATSVAGVEITNEKEDNEMLIVVNDKDEVVSYRSRFDCHHDASLRHRIVAVILFDDKHRVLLQKRSFTKAKHPGLWAVTASGHVSKGEKYEEAAARELKEEMGVTVPLTFVKTYIEKPDEESEMVAAYTGLTSEEIHPNAEEVSEALFVTKDELLRSMLSGKIQLTPCAYQALQEIQFL